MAERVFSTIVYANWNYASTKGVDFDKAWYFLTIFQNVSYMYRLICNRHTVKSCILEAFAGVGFMGFINIFLFINE
jgi:hypothetical protein